MNEATGFCSGECPTPPMSEEEVEIESLIRRLNQEELESRL